MRISDWSSDVCSSDLPADPAGLHWSDYRGRARLLAWSLAHERALMRLSEVLGTSLVPQEPADDEIADDDAVWLAFATDGAAETVVEPLRGAMRFPIGWLSSLRDRAERSEENKAELQSLLRISYAVFCLKKQQNPHSTSET